MQFEDFALKSNVLAFASRSKAKAKPQRRISASSSTRTVPIGERTWADIEPQDYWPIDYPVSKQLSTLLRHGHLPREDDGAIEFWRLKDDLRTHFVYSQQWSDEKWKSTMAKRRRQQEKISVFYRSFRRNSLPPSSARSFRTQSHRSFMTGQCFNSGHNFFEYIYHVGCAINLHSIMNSGLISGGQNLSNRQTVFFLPVDPMDKEHKDPETVDLKAQRLAQYMHTAWKKHTVYWVHIRLAQKKD